MRNRPKAFLRSSLSLSYLLVAATFGPTTARGSSTTISAPSYSGAITGQVPGVSLPSGVAIGDSITGGFAYNPGQIGSSSNGVYTFTTASKPDQLMYFNVPGTTFGDAYVSGSYTITIADTSGGGATFDIHAVTAVEKYVSGGSSSTEAAYIDLKFTAAKYSGLSLPTTTSALGAFNLGAGSLTWDPITPIGPEGFVATISVDLNQLGGPGGPLPEPSSFMLAIVALTTGAAGCLFARRKAA